MDEQLPQSTEHDLIPATDYAAPTASYLGDVEELTEKTAGAADGTMFLGIDVGS
jgi:hypothetical protein